MTQTWPEITEQLKQDRGWASVGGLGTLREKGRFGLWLCVRDHECAPVNDHFCFVFDQHTEEFIPWDTANSLGLERSCSIRR